MASVADFLAQVEPAQRRADGQVLLTLMARITGEPARMWGPTIIGFGTYHYKYATGREGHTIRVGFSPRRAALSLYLAQCRPLPADLLARLGKDKTGAGCLYINKLADVDRTVLEEMVVRAWKNVG